MYGVYIPLSASLFLSCTASSQPFSLLGNEQTNSQLDLALPPLSVSSLFTVNNRKCHSVSPQEQWIHVLDGVKMNGVIPLLASSVRGYAVILSSTFLNTWWWTDTCCYSFVSFICPCLRCHFLLNYPEGLMTGRWMLLFCSELHLSWCDIIETSVSACPQHQSPVLNHWFPFPSLTSLFAWI